MKPRCRTSIYRIAELTPNLEIHMRWWVMIAESNASGSVRAMRDRDVSSARLARGEAGSTAWPEGITHPPCWLQGLE